MTEAAGGGGNAFWLFTGALAGGGGTGACGI